ncbi:hypothetical protein QW131_17740 [Roseibium salinum]|nr:hypothetical protein [Roseibium salinum]
MTEKDAVSVAFARMEQVAGTTSHDGDDLLHIAGKFWLRAKSGCNIGEWPERNNRQWPRPEGVSQR